MSSVPDNATVSITSRNMWSATNRSVTISLTGSSERVTLHGAMVTMENVWQAAEQLLRRAGIPSTDKPGQPG